MSIDSVKGQCRTILVGIRNLTEGHKSQFNQGLETVTDSAHKSVSVFKQIVYSLLYLAVSEKRGDKFARAVRLIASGEATGDKYNLTVLKAL